MDTTTAIIAFGFLVIAIIFIVMVWKHYPKLETYGFTIKSYELNYNGNWHYTQEEFEELRSRFIGYCESRINGGVFDACDINIDNQYLTIMTGFVDHLRSAIIYTTKTPATAERLLEDLNISTIYSALESVSHSLRGKDVISKDLDKRELIFSYRNKAFEIIVKFDIVDYERV